LTITATPPVVMISTAAASGSGSGLGSGAGWPSIAVSTSCRKSSVSATSLDLFTVDRAPVLPAGVQPDRGHHHRERCEYFARNWYAAP
jgi:hypothetical protein